MNIVKAEILWSRRCNLRCPYCKMADGRSNTFPVDRWLNGMKSLSKLGCKFVAFYGAEPLIEYEGLGTVIQYAEELGMATTVITSGKVPDFEKKLEGLYNHGLRSLTMSWDVGENSDSVQRKSTEAPGGLNFFRKLGDKVDVAAVMTVTRRNIQFISEHVKFLSDNGIYSLFDFIHPDRGQPGSKCSSSLSTEALLVDGESASYLVLELFVLKNKGYKIHASDLFLSGVFVNGSIVEDFSWNCGREDNFPAWVTVDCDGLVYPCDDFQPRNISNITIDRIHSRWEEFVYRWKPEVLKCPGCVWNTHIDAHYIKRGVLDIDPYIHAEERR